MRYNLSFFIFFFFFSLFFSNFHRSALQTYVNGIQDSSVCAQIMQHIKPEFCENFSSNFQKIEKSLSFFLNLMESMKKSLQNVCYRFLIADITAAWLLGRCPPPTTVTYYMLVHQFDLTRTIDLRTIDFLKRLRRTFNIIHIMNSFGNGIDIASLLKYFKKWFLCI